MKTSRHSDWGAFTFTFLICASNCYALGAWGQCESELCTDPKGCVELQPGEPVRIATFLPETGSGVPRGNDCKRGLELGLHTLGASKNAIGGAKMTFLNHVVSFVDFDEGSGSFSGDQLKAIATSIVRDPKILFTVGTQRSGDAITTLGIFTDAGHILISHSNTNPDLTDPAEFPPPSFYARLVFNDDIQGQVMANFANLTLLATAAATIDDDSAYGIGLTTTFRSYFDGSSVAKSLATQTPSQIASDLSANPPKIIFFAGSGVANAIAVANAIKNNGAFTNTALAFGDSQFASAFFAGGTAVEGVYVSAPDLTAVADPDFYNNKFLPTYVKDFGEPPTTGFHIFAYDIIHVMAQAAEQVVCRTKGGSDRVGRQALYDQLLATTNFKGLAATYTCDSSGDCNPDPAIAIYQVQSGQFVKIQ